MFAHLSYTYEKPPFGSTVLVGTVGDFQLFVGMSDRSAEQLIVYSSDILDTSLQDNTGDKKRFRDKESVRRWYDDVDRHVFTLSSFDGILGGLAWFRRAELPHVTTFSPEYTLDLFSASLADLHTSAIRLYAPCRGQGLGTPFLQKTKEIYESLYPSALICIDIDATNIPSQKIHEKNGFIRVGIGENIKSFGGAPQQRLVYVAGITKIKTP